MGSLASNLSTSHHTNSNIYHPPAQYHDACLILHQEFVHQPSSTSFSTGAVFLYLLSSDIWIIFWHDIWYRSLSSS